MTKIYGGAASFFSDDDGAPLKSQQHSSGWIRLAEVQSTNDTDAFLHRTTRGRSNPGVMSHSPAFWIARLVGPLLVA